MYEASLKIREELAKISEDNDRRQTELMLALAHTGQSGRALELADRFSAGAQRRSRAAHFSRLLLCPGRPGHSTRERRAVQTALVKAVDAVRTAVRAGFRDRVYLETEPDLEPIRNRDDFTAILQGIPNPKL